MKQVIHNIRQRPDHHKDRIIWITAISTIVLLIIIWAIVGNGRRTTPDDNFFQIFNNDFQSGKSNTNIPLDDGLSPNQ